MKSKEKSKKQPESVHQFTFPISENSFFEAVEFAEKEKKNLVSVQLLRPGSFRHPWWGVLRFDNKFFDDLIKNFEANIPQEEIAFDFKHNPDWGAAAWVKGLSRKKEGLFAEVEFTKKGRDSIKNKEFKYFSSEYSDDYVMYDFEVDEEENEIEKKISYGPVLLGGGLTNRPFIKGMKPVSLSEDGTQVEMEEILENDLNLSEEVKKSMKTIEELQKEKGVLEEKVKELEEKKDEKSKGEHEELVAKLAEIDKAVKDLSDKDLAAKEEERKKKEEEEAGKAKSLEDQLENQKKELTERDEKIKTLSDNLNSLSESVKELTESNKVLHSDKVKAVTEKKLGDLKKIGVFPSTMKVIEPILFSEEAKGFSVTLSEKVDDEEKEIKKSLAEIIYDIMESIPKDHRFSEAENSRTEIDPDGKKELSVDDVQKYADENKLAYAEALVELNKQGKV